MINTAKIGIGAKLTALIAVITLVTLSLIGISLTVLNSQKDDSTIINIAGRQRMLSQKMSKEAMAIRAGLAVNEMRDKLLKTHVMFDNSLKSLINGSKQLNLPPTTDPEILTQMRRVEKIWKSFSAQVLVLTTPGQSEAAQSRAAEKILQGNLLLLKEMNRAVNLYEQASRAKVQSLRTLLLGGGLFSLIVTFLCWLMINRKVVRPLRRVLDMVLNMAKGNLNQRLEMHRNDEIGRLADAMDKFADNLNNEILTAFNRLAAGDFTFVADGLISKPLADANQGLIASMLRVQEASAQISSGAVQVADSSTSLANGATQQAAALEEISASMTQMNEQTANNAANASTANKLVISAKQAAEKGNQQMQSMVSAMDEIKEAGQNISKIIKVIDEIAFQTNLLALNAAVEAARAGQHGKGFAVVAEEVRNLAARSAKAARETTALIEGSVEKTDNGAQIADQTAAALTEIVDGVTKVSDLVAEIAAASHEQSQGIAQVNEGLQQLDDVNQKSTSTAEESAAIAEELSSQTADLQQMLKGFKLGSQQTASAPSAPRMPRQHIALPEKQTATSAEGWGSMDNQVDIKLDDTDFGKY